jgi:hypothetical protein
MSISYGTNETTTGLGWQSGDRQREDDDGEERREHVTKNDSGCIRQR